MRQLSAMDIFETVEVDLWGNKYTLRLVTRSVAPQLDAAQKALTELPDDATDDDAIGAMIAPLGLMLAPANGEPPAAELLKGLWEKDELGVDWLSAFYDALMEESEARRRPTSAPTTGG